MKTKKNTFVKLLTQGILLLAFSLFWGCQQEEFYLPQQEAQLIAAKQWVQKYHNTAIEQNKFYFKTYAWEKAVIHNGRIYIPLLNTNSTNYFIEKSKQLLKREIKIHSFLSLLPKADNTYQESLVAYFDVTPYREKKFSDILTLPFQEFDQNNHKIYDSFSQTKGLRTNNNCKLYYIVNIKTYSNGSTSTEILGTEIVCTPNKDDGGGGGNMSLSTTNWPHSDCASFEFANVNGIKGAHTTGVKNMFTAYKMTSPTTSQITVISIFYPSLFFTMPNHWTNGRAATLTATAIDTSIDITSNWFRANPNASKHQLQLVWFNSLKAQMAIYGGTVRTKPLFKVKSPAPYTTSIFKRNCG